MSRIHEALKKAAQERNAQLVSPSGPDLVELEAEASARIAVAPSLEVADLTLPQQPIVHGVPGRFERLVQKCNSVQWKVESKSSIFVRERENFLVAEKFRTLRSRLYQIAAVQKLRSIVVSSSVPAEGKTFVAASLAVSFIRQADKRVLLIDGDGPIRFSSWKCHRDRRNTSRSGWEFVFHSGRKRRDQPERTVAQRADEELHRSHV